VVNFKTYLVEGTRFDGADHAVIGLPGQRGEEGPIDGGFVIPDSFTVERAVHLPLSLAPPGVMSQPSPPKMVICVPG
jgi:hypothetical protein